MEDSQASAAAMVSSFQAHPSSLSDLDRQETDVLVECDR